jgi:hypothetical protein
VKRKTQVVLLALLALTLAPATTAQKGETSRTIRGQVLGLDGKPVAEALVHMKNRSTGTVLTVVTDKDGRYLFTGVPLGIDCDLYAEFQNLRSRSKRFSGLDRRTRIFLDFDLQKDEKKTPAPADKGAKPNH